MKKCTKCNEEKLLEAFPKIYSTKKDGSPVSDGRRANCRVCENARRKRTYQCDIKSRLLMNAKMRAKRDNLEINITKEDIHIPEICPLLKVSFIIGEGTNYTFTPTIDRVDSNRGYTKDNIKVICMLANRMKTNANNEQLLVFAKNISKYLMI